MPVAPRLSWVKPERHASGVRVRLTPDGYARYSARLDTHAEWPGMSAVVRLRLDPTSEPGEFEIGFLNIARMDDNG